MFATGLVGVIKSVNTFNPQKEIQFSSYASAVIRNEIIMSLMEKRPLEYCSIDEPLVSENGDNLYFYDVIEDKKCMEDEVVAKTHIENVFRTLKERQKSNRTADLRKGAAGGRANVWDYTEYGF